MTDPDLAAAFLATWPAAEYAEAGGFRVGRGMGAGGRVGSGRAAGPWSDADIDRIVRIQRNWGEPPLIAVDDDDAALAATLKARGWLRHRPTLVMQAQVSALTDREIPPVTAMDLWPPLAIQRDIWADQGIDAARQAVMERTPGPKAAILGRVQDRAGGAAFAAVHGPIAMVHAVAVLPPLRRMGLAGWMVRRAATFAANQGAARLVLTVRQSNEGALALYAGLGFIPCGGYSYWKPPVG
ncbi:MAG TPA: GNAT family N-acetyltransferase [Paracoccus sp. (in: a-proteobacteria)]|nr:GNAT family N-acetyltransferase [Paracoccus sp. (in: a-proteobacteria)]